MSPRKFPWFAITLLLALSESAFAGSLVKGSIIRGQSNDGCHNYAYALSFIAPASGAVVATISGLKNDVTLNHLGISPGAQPCIGTCVNGCLGGAASAPDQVSPLLIDLRPASGPFLPHNLKLVTGQQLVSNQAIYLIDSGLIPGAAYSVLFDYDYCFGFSNCLTIEVFEKICP